MRKITMLAVLMLLALSITACSSAIDVKKLNESTLAVTKDGTLNEISVAGFTESYYSYEELNSFVTAAVNEYNSTRGSEAITDIDIQVSETDARVVLSYSDVQAYTEFNRADINIGGMDILDSLGDEAAALNYVTRAKAESAAVADLDASKYKVVITRSALNLMVEGKIEYISDNVTVVDKNHVNTTDELSVIIYK